MMPVEVAPSPQLMFAEKSVVGELSGLGPPTPSVKVATVTGPLEMPSMAVTGEAVTAMSGAKPTVPALKDGSSMEKNVAWAGMRGVVKSTVPALWLVTAKVLLGPS